MKDINYQSTQIYYLDGEWMLAIDPENKGREESWFTQISEDAKPARVPWIIQDTFPAYHGVAWYWRYFDCPVNPHANGRYLLRFNAVDYVAEVWVNGINVGGHEGSETPFTLDITSAVSQDKENLLAVRVLNPTNEPIDGIVLSQTPHRNKTVPYSSGCSFNIGGILESVELQIAPAVRITDLYVKPDPATGRIGIYAALLNTAESRMKCSLQFCVSPAAGGETCDAAALETAVPAGESTVESALTVTDWKLWDLNSPNLYRVSAQIECGGSIYEQTVRCGFRTFEVKNGYFRLNGRRIFLKSTHTGNHCPIGALVPLKTDKDVLLTDLLYAKSMGFNMVRFISGAAHPYQLDFCDEIGLMVYEESYAAWCLEDSTDMGRRMDFSNREMLIRDRNHPSITICGMLNETVNNATYQHAKASLGLVRSLDDSRLVLLGSGRWDGEWKVGSVSNPGSDSWEYMWGEEGPDAADSAFATWAGGCMEGAGDIHIYPSVPHTLDTELKMRSLGRDSKPVFISEYGIGSTMNVIREWKKCQESQANLAAEDAALLKQWSESYVADWKKLGFDDVYAFPEDMLRHSQQLTARWREYGFDIIRSNPNICGFNLTGMLDHGMSGEGVWTFWREFKPGVVDKTAEGWAPLRWCVFANPMHGYSGQPFTFEVVLANEDVLPPGRYPVHVKIFGRHGTVWERETAVDIPVPAPGEDGPLAVGVMREEVVLDVPAGKYELIVNMTDGGAPAGGRLAFHVSDIEDLAQVYTDVILWGVDESIQSWLEYHWITCHDFKTTVVNNGDAVVLVGNSDDLIDDAEGWNRLYNLAKSGVNVVFASPLAFRRRNGSEIDTAGWFPLENKGRCWEFPDWLYHKECVAKPHPIFAGLPNRGIMDWEYYGSVISSTILTDQDTPTDVAAAAFAAGHSCGGYQSGVMICSYPFGKGKIVINTFNILDHLSVNPAADKMMLNLLNYASSLYQ